MLSKSVFSTKLHRRDLLCFTLKRCCSTSAEQRTPLYDLHLKYDGKMVNFAGFSMPVQYGTHGISASHLHTRSKSSVFDVSHMLQTVVRGKDKDAWLESICVADVQGLNPGKATLSVFTNEQGGILDDFIATKTKENSLYLVSNASRKQSDMQTMLEAQRRFKAQGREVHLEFLSPSECGLIALQGPLSSQALQKLVDTDLSKLYFMNSILCRVTGIDCRVSRVGYTGEDGFEISIPSDKCEHIVEALLSDDDNVKLAGLGARDSLRLEAGLCLYGNDMDETTTPVEAALTWTVAKQRRVPGSFPGVDIILQQIKSGIVRKRTGFTSTGVPVRPGYEIFDSEGRQVGIITSGCPSPSLKKNIAMGYIEPAASKSKLSVKARDKHVEVQVTKMPFVKSNYYSAPK